MAVPRIQLGIEEGTLKGDPEQMCLAAGSFSRKYFKKKREIAQGSKKVLAKDELELTCSQVI